ncbi:MAG: cupin domain-containing protein [Betaproteobacteria bacterium]
MVLKKAAERTWTAGPPGVERALFRHGPTEGRASVLRLAAGAHVPRHGHAGREEVVVLVGTVQIGGIQMVAGDYLLTEPGEEHDVLALSDAEIFVTLHETTTATAGRAP